MTTIIVINLLLSFFDNRLFFDSDYIKFLKYKNSIIKTDFVIPQMKYEFYKRVSKIQKQEKINLFTMEKPEVRYIYIKGPYGELINIAPKKEYVDILNNNPLWKKFQ